MTDNSIASSSNVADKYESLLKWCRLNGAIIPETLIISSDLTGGHCLTTADIPAGEAIFQIPEKICITTTVAVNAFSELAPFTAHAQLCAFLSLERKRDGFWKPYIDALPETFTTAVSFTNEELELLKGTSLYYAVSERLTSWKQEYTEVSTVLSQLEWYILQYSD
jgi:hypothetical protein